MDNKDEKLALQKNAKILLIISALFTTAIGLSNTFVNIYLWRIKENFVSIGIFNLFIHICLPLTFILSGYLTKKKDGTTALRLGIIFHAVFFIAILLLREKAADYLILLGSFLGIAGGFFWLAFQVLSFDLTTDMNRDTFNSYNGIAGSISGMIAPFIAGLIISNIEDLTGYYLVFGISFVIFIVIVLISLKLHTEKTREGFKLIKILKNPNKSWKSIMIGTFSYGIRNGVLLFLVNLMVFIVAESELSVGKMTLVGGFLSAVSFEFIEKVMKPDRRKLFITTGTIMMFIAITPLLLKINFLYIIIFIILNSIFTPFFNVPFNSATYNLIDKNKDSKKRVEFIIYKELILNLGRILGIIIFIFTAGNNKNISNLKWLLLIIGSSQLIIPFLVKGINDKAEVL